MGVNGAGKTTLLDVLAGRKTRGCLKGEIKINGYPIIQETFARISGLFCFYLVKLTQKLKLKLWAMFFEITALDEIKDDLVGIPGVSGLSTEQRKRLTIAVELVANPSVLFMDETTSGLDMRASTIIIQAMRNIADTGRTIVCTIHQPSIDIFEAFDELLLLKAGGRLIYYGPLGQHSSKVVNILSILQGFQI
ncbi:Pleiotropic drug resistance ABC transporter [Quillaja saponaria]|uniref:Pleiotropic drug resistance ABC transporter n=1 Tax=Quillaja saponaria TaxID=32244 RepID=A0AAD7QA99_QUISA|nr:Pleiotropic drug resistance ABC transporter [Quillaja saponaria]